MITFVEGDPGLTLSGEARAGLEQLAVSTHEPDSALRAQAVLQLADGTPVREVAHALGMSTRTVMRWRDQYRSSGTITAARRGRPAQKRTAQAAEHLWALTVQQTPPEAAPRWYAKAAGDAVGLSDSKVRQLWQTAGLDPRARTWRLWADPTMQIRVRSVCGIKAVPSGCVLALRVRSRRPSRPVTNTDHSTTIEPSPALGEARALLSLVHAHAARTAPARKTASTLVTEIENVLSTVPAPDQLHVLIHTPDPEAFQHALNQHDTVSQRVHLHRLPTEELWWQFAEHWLPLLSPAECRNVITHLQTCWSQIHRQPSTLWVRPRRLPSQPVTWAASARLTPAQRHTHRLDLIARRPANLREELPVEPFWCLHELRRNAHECQRRGTDPHAEMQWQRDDVDDMLVLAADMLARITAVEPTLVQHALDLGRDYHPELLHITGLRADKALQHRVDWLQARRRNHNRPRLPSHRPTSLGATRTASEAIRDHRADLIADGRCPATAVLDTDDPLDLVEAVAHTARLIRRPADRAPDLLQAISIVTDVEYRVHQHIDFAQRIGDTLGMTNTALEAPLGRTTRVAAFASRLRRSQLLHTDTPTRSTPAPTGTPPASADPASTSTSAVAHRCAQVCLHYLESDDADLDEDLQLSTELLRDAFDEGEILAGRWKILHYMARHELHDHTLYQHYTTFADAVETICSLTSPD